MRPILAPMLLVAAPACAMQQRTIALPGPDGVTLTAGLFLPENRVAPRRPAQPPPILIGEVHDWTPAAPRAQPAMRDPQRITCRAHPGAHHGFDAPNTPIRTRSGLAFTANGKGVAHYGSDLAARASAFFNLGR